MPCCIWGMLSLHGSRNLQLYLHLKAFVGGGHFDFVKSSVPHSLSLSFFVHVRFL